MTISFIRLRLGRASALCLLALAAALFHAQEARAQWSQPDAAGNISNTNTGNIGIGTTTPDFTGWGPSRRVLTIRGFGERGVLELASPTTGTNGIASSIVGMNGTARLAQIDIGADGTPDSGNMRFFTWNAGVYGERLRIDRVGNVSFGGAAPLAPIQIGGYTTINNSSAPAHSQFINNAYFAGGWKYMNNDTASLLQVKDGLSLFTAPAGTTGTALTFTERVRIDSAGHIGIGTTTPGMLNGVNFASYIPLHVQGQGTTMANILIDSAAPGSGLVINDSSQPVDNRIWTVSQGAGGGKLSFATYTDAGTRTDRVVIDRAGNLGVGTLAPVSRLHVSGDITVDGNINAKYQDVAEWVPTTQKLEAGTVVILDPERPNHVLASTASYDTAVAGVVSARPGLALGERGENKALVATTGRVKVKVDATRAPIKIGDLIVTSDVAGVAMKSEPVMLGGRKIHAPGTIIGKALEPLEKGTGEILVLLSLQ